MFATLVGELIATAYRVANRSGRPLDPPLLVVLDEAANIAPLADLDVLASTAAGHGVQLVTIWQDVSQINARYGSRAGSVVNNHRAKLFLAGICDPPTLEQVSMLAGEAGAYRQSVTRDEKGKASLTEAEVRERLVAPDALRRLVPGQALLLYGHLPPVALRLLPSRLVSAGLGGSTRG